MRKKITTPELEKKKTKRNLRVTFSDPELLQLGKDLADKTTELRELEEDKKRVVSDFGARITAKEAEVSLLTSKLKSGYEYRMVNCTETLDFPTLGRKTISRDDTGADIAVEDMTSAEMQRELIKEGESEPVTAS